PTGPDRCKAHHGPALDPARPMPADRPTGCRIEGAAGRRASSADLDQGLAEVVTAEHPDEGLGRPVQSLGDVLAVADLPGAHPGAHVGQEVLEMGLGELALDE